MRPCRGPIKAAITRAASVAVFAVLSVAAVSVVAPSRAVASHIDLTCPDPVTEGDTAQMGVRTAGWMRGPKVYTFRFDHTASSDDFTPYYGTRFEPAETTLWIPIETTEDTRPEHDETFSIGFFSLGSWHGCVVTIIDDDRPITVEVAFSEELRQPGLAAAVAPYLSD